MRTGGDNAEQREKPPDINISLKPPRVRSNAEIRPEHGYVLNSERHTDRSEHGYVLNSGAIKTGNRGHGLCVCVWLLFLSVSVCVCAWLLFLSVCFGVCVCVCVCVCGLCSCLYMFVADVETMFLQ